MECERVWAAEHARLHADPPAILNHRLNLLVRAQPILRACVPRMIHSAPHRMHHLVHAREHTYPHEILRAEPILRLVHRADRDHLRELDAEINAGICAEVCAEICVEMCAETVG